MCNDAGGTLVNNRCFGVREGWSPDSCCAQGEQMG
jgi:hypothetical protein